MDEYRKENARTNAYPYEKKMKMGLYVLPNLKTPCGFKI